jgi:hypothetical protein
MLLFILTAADFKYIDTHMIMSSNLHQDNIKCEINELNSKKSPDQRGTATPKVGKQK